MGHDPDFNPYCLPKRYRNKFPREFVGGQPCMEEFNALFDCLILSKFDKQPCEEANRQVNNCMVANVWKHTIQNIAYFIPAHYILIPSTNSHPPYILSQYVLFTISSLLFLMKHVNHFLYIKPHSLHITSYFTHATMIHHNTLYLPIFLTVTSLLIFSKAKPNKIIFQISPF